MRMPWLVPRMTMLIILASNIFSEKNIRIFKEYIIVPSVKGNKRGTSHLFSIDNNAISVIATRTYISSFELQTDQGHQKKASKPYLFIWHDAFQNISGKGTRPCLNNQIYAPQTSYSLKGIRPSDKLDNSYFNIPLVANDISVLLYALVSGICFRVRVALTYLKEHCLYITYYCFLCQTFIIILQKW